MEFIETLKKKFKKKLITKQCIYQRKNGRIRQKYDWNIY